MHTAKVPSNHGNRNFREEAEPGPSRKALVTAASRNHTDDDLLIRALAGLHVNFDQITSHRLQLRSVLYLDHYSDASLPLHLVPATREEEKEE